MKKKKNTDAILKQKNANNKKAEAIYCEHRERRKHTEPTGKENESGSKENKILLKKARIAIGATVKWEREYRGLKDEERQARTDRHKSPNEVRYSSRMIACTRCGSQQETRSKQLKVEAGFRAIHCRKCGKQERVHSNKCACQLVWHQCQLHRVDPIAHCCKKTKGKRHTGKQTGRKVKLKSSMRIAPTISEASLQDKRDLQKRKKEKSGKLRTKS